MALFPPKGKGIDDEHYKRSRCTLAVYKTMLYQRVAMVEI